MCKNEYRKQAIRSDEVVQNSIRRENHSFPGVDRQLDKRSFRNSIDEALAELDELKRSTFLLRYEDELSIKEISQIMECSEGTVKSRLFYTLKSLHEKLKVYELIGLCLWLILRNIHF